MEVARVRIPDYVDTYARKRAVAIVLVGTETYLRESAEQLLERLRDVFPNHDDAKCYIVSVPDESEKTAEGIHKTFGIKKLPAILVYQGGERNCFPIDTVEKELEKITRGVQP